MAEIAGLVLGVVPLVISALEHWQEFIKTTLTFLRWRRQLSQITRRLLMEHTAYEQNLRLLLKRAVSSEDLAEMIDNPQNHLWKSRDLVSDLKSDLGEAYKPSLSTIEEMAAIMATIASGLNIEGADKVTQQGLEVLVFANPPLSNSPNLRRRFDFKDRIIFTMKRWEINEKVEQLEKCNARLYGFLEKAEKIHAVSQEDLIRKARIQFVAPLQSIQTNASRVHHGLHRRWCAENHCHQAGLLLEQRLIRRKRHRQGALRDVGKKDRFSVSLWRVPVMTWLETEFRVDDGSMSPLCGSKAPRVTFSLVDVEERLDEALQQTSLEVKDICIAIEKATHPRVGFALDSFDILRGLYDVQTQACALASSQVTLEEFLPSIKRKEYVLADFYCLAITLVSSVLQLGETPWLQQPWSRQTIAFLRLKDDNDPAVDIKHPYLTCQYDTEDHPLVNTNPHMQPPDRMNMLALAIMLLELNCGTPIESLRRDEDLGPDGKPNMGTDLSTATRWLDAQVSLGNLTCGFTSAITYCLQCYLDPTASLEDAEFLQSVEDRVLEPLEREMQLLLWG